MRQTLIRVLELLIIVLLVLLLRLVLSPGYQGKNPLA